MLLVLRAGLGVQVGTEDGNACADEGLLSQHLWTGCKMSSDHVPHKTNQYEIWRKGKHTVANYQCATSSFGSMNTTASTCKHFITTMQHPPG